MSVLQKRRTEHRTERKGCIDRSSVKCRLLGRETGMGSSPGVGKSTVEEVEEGQCVVIEKTRGRMAQDEGGRGQVRHLEQYEILSPESEYLSVLSLHLGPRLACDHDRRQLRSPPHPVMDPLYMQNE